MAPPSRHNDATLLGASGRPIPAPVREDMETRFGHDFGHVRIHDHRAARTATDVAGAQAMTHGAAIALGSEVNDLSSTGGRAVLAHELVHVMQRDRFGEPQPSAGSKPPRLRSDEAEARDLAGRALGDPASAPLPAVGTRPTAEFQPLAPPESAEAYLPDEAELLATLNAKDLAGRKTFVADALAGVKPRWARAEAAGLTAKLDKTRSADAAMAKSAVKPVAGLPKNAPSAFRENLMIDAKGEAENDLGRKLVKDEITVDSVALTGATAARAVMNLRRLDDTLTRILSASTAAGATFTPLTDVLAMYRTEGDLNAPPSTASLTAGIPSGKHDARTSLNPRPDLSHLVWLADAAHPWVAGKPDALVKELALRFWFVQIGGLDVVGGLPAPVAAAFANWSADNWLRATDTVPDAGAVALARLKAADRWKALIDTMEVATKPSATGGSPAVQVSPKDPEVLVAGILEEAVMLQRRLGKVASLPGVTPAAAAPKDMTPGMAYLHYHAGTEQMQQIMVSAALAAAASTDARYKTLRTAIKAGLNVTALRTKMTLSDKNAKKLGDSALPAADKAALESENATLAGDMWSLLTTWLNADTTRVDLLGTFIETADSGIWSAWSDHRGNLSRYNVLRAYYALL